MSSIITAFASFNKLKREQGDNYNGGILLIDEIDAGFHPRAQIKLIKLMKEEAKKITFAGNYDFPFFNNNTRGLKNQ